jgi:hypothetical protein
MPTVLAPIEITTRPKWYPRVGHCIYCGDGSKKLSDEHIIPFGLAGNSLVLRKASCSVCAGATKKAETACLRHMWWPFRFRIGVPSRGKEIPQSFLVRRIKATKNQAGEFDFEFTTTEEVAPNEFPLAYCSLRLPPPAVLVDRDVTAQVNYEAWARVSPEEFKKHAPNDKDGIAIALVEPDAFVRMLAKIAHSYAVAELGEAAFSPVLCDFIRGKPMRALQWIGGELRDPPATSSFHDIRWRIQTVNVTHYVVVDLRLFCFMASPLYRIVVGRLISPFDELPFIEQPPYTIDIVTAPAATQFVPLGGAIERAEI